MTSQNHFTNKIFLAAQIVLLVLDDSLRLLSDITAHYPEKDSSYTLEVFTLMMNPSFEPYTCLTFWISTVVSLCSHQHPPFVL